MSSVSVEILPWLAERMSVGSVVILLFLGIFVVKQLQPKSKLPSPPGPKGWPIVGSIADVLQAVKQHRVHLLFSEWAQKYGDIMMVTTGPTTEYYLNTDIAIRTLLDGKSAVTSERPRWIVANEMICNRWNLLLLSASSARWKLQRKIAVQNITGIPRADAAIPLLEFETLKFLWEVVHDPTAGTDQQDLWTQMGRYLYSLFTTQVFGLEIKDAGSPSINYLFESGATQIFATLPGAFIVDSFNWLENLPSWLKPWEAPAKEQFARDLEWTRARVKHVKQLMALERVPDSFLPRTLEDPTLGGLESEDEAGFLSMQLVLGGADTSRLATWGFMEAMLMNPEIMSKAQKMVDDVCGDRLPGWADFDSLPYVRCIMKEVWRMRPVSATGFAHVTTTDLEYNGYHIPKGATLRPNAWAVSYNPDRHHEPYRFMPERYADDMNTSQQPASLTDVTKRDHFSFGAGRKICPGMHVAERSFSVAIMRILWAFDIKAAPRAGNGPIDPSKTPHDIPGTTGPEFPINMVPRSAKKAAQIDELYAAALASRPEYGSVDLGPI